MEQYANLEKPDWLKNIFSSEMPTQQPTKAKTPAKMQPAKIAKVIAPNPMVIKETISKIIKKSLYKIKD